VLALMAAPLVAQESTEQLRKELESLRKEVDGLKADRAQYESKEIPADGKAGKDGMAPDGDSPVMTLLKDTKLSGFVDTGYMFSFNEASSSKPFNNQNNPIRVFDNRSNSFYLHAAQLNIENLATDKRIVGYHLELAAGHDPTVYDAQSFSLQEGWIQILAPVGTGLDIRIGKMATLVGYEVIESKDDMNYSRSILFGQAENFTNTGIRATYNINEQMWVVLGFNNGLNFTNDTFSDDGHGKCTEMQFGMKPSKDMLVTATLLVGTEENLSASTNDKFYIFDIVGSYTMDKLTLALNLDITSIQGVGNDVSANGRAPRTGIALYAKYQESDMMASAVRVEYFSDSKGGTFGPTAASDTGDGARFFEFTFTQEAKVSNQLTLRVELRFDNCNQHVFLRDNNAAMGDTTLGFEAILGF
jgi:hypothetical protein